MPVKKTTSSRDKSRKALLEPYGRQAVSLRDYPVVVKEAPKAAAPSVKGEAMKERRKEEARLRRNAKNREATAKKREEKEKRSKLWDLNVPLNSIVNLDDREKERRRQIWKGTYDFSRDPDYEKRVMEEKRVAVLNFMKDPHRFVVEERITECMDKFKKQPWNNPCDKNYAENTLQEHLFELAKKYKDAQDSFVNALWVIDSHNCKCMHQ